MKGNVNYLELANSPLMWVSAAIAVGIVVFQSVLFFRKSLKAAKEIGIEQEKINMAIKSSAISSIGPSIVILVTMISLIVSMGAPVSWMRLSFIGSVNYEAMAAGFGAQAMGATLENTGEPDTGCICLRCMDHDLWFTWMADFHTPFHR